MSTNLEQLFFQSHSMIAVPCPNYEETYIMYHPYHSRSKFHMFIIKKKLKKHV